METEEEKEEDVEEDEEGDEGEEKNNREVPIKEGNMLDELIEHEDEGGDEDEEEDEEEEEEVNNEERGHVEIKKQQSQHENEAIDEVPKGEQEDGIPVSEDEQQHEEEEVQEEGSIKIEIIENPQEPTLEEQLAKANKKVYKWMASIEPQEIGRTLWEWDNVSLLKMIEMADQEIRENPQKFV
jgi:hypothetical protein